MANDIDCWSNYTDKNIILPLSLQYEYIVSNTGHNIRKYNNGEKYL